MSASQSKASSAGQIKPAEAQTESRDPEQIREEIDQTRESVQTREAEMAKLVEAVKSKEKLLSERDSDVQGLRPPVPRTRADKSAAWCHVPVRSPSRSSPGAP